MATTPDFIEYVCSQVKDAGTVRYRRMFGEYLVYVDEKPALLVCDNTVYIKQVPALESILKEVSTGVPYEGSKEHYMLDIDDEKLSTDVARILARELPLSKPKKKKP